MIDILRASIFFILGFLAQLVLIITGLFVCLLPKSKDKSKCVPFTVPSNIGSWFPVHLPAWFWLWDNDGDGARGDKRGWFWCEYMPDYPDGLKYWFWLAIRNPANNFKRFVLGFDIRTAEIKTIYGVDYVRDDFESTGFQLVKAGWRYHFYLVWRHNKYTRWFFTAIKFVYLTIRHLEVFSLKGVYSTTSGNAIVIELGNKFQVRHNGTTYESEHKYFKGFTFEVNPYKDIS